MKPLPNLRCPLCGAANECAAAQSGSFDTPCWCASVTVDPQALAAIPEAVRDRACLCARCAAGGARGARTHERRNRRAGRRIAASAALALTVAALPVRAADTPPHIGVLAGTESLVIPVGLMLPGRLGLLGYEEGRDFKLETRYAQKDEELPRLAGVRVLVAEGPAALAAATALPNSPPIVGIWMTGTRPPAGVTGIALERSNRQRLEVLKTLLPELTRVAVLRNPAQPAEFADAEQAARALGLQVHPLELAATDDLLVQISATRAGAILIPDAPVLTVIARVQPAPIALPILYPQAYWIRPPRSGLVSFGVDGARVHGRIAALVDRILKGAQPSDLPVETVSAFELVINKRQAAALGLALPRALLERADRIIE